MPDISVATRATFVVFALNGFAFASFASRIPQLKERLELSPGELGFVLLAVAVGSVISLPLSGPVVSRFGSRRIVAVEGVLAGVGLIAIALGYQVGLAPVVVGLFILGVATAGWDVAMNVQGALVERRLGRAIMSRFHGAYSLGTVAGALGGTVMVALAIPVTAHLLVVGVAAGIAVPIAARGYLPDETVASRASARRSLEAWTEPRTLLIGVFVLAFAFGEGAGNDWIGVALIDDRGAHPAVGTLALAAFLAAMTATRWFGPALLDRYGRVPVIRALILIGVAGLVLFSFGPSTPVAFAGVLLWGAGISLGFPVGMSAGADDPAHAAARVGVVSSIGYCAFLAGPPLIGFLGEHDTVLHALAAILVPLALAAAVSGAVRPLS